MHWRRISRFINKAWRVQLSLSRCVRYACFETTVATTTVAAAAAQAEIICLFWKMFDVHVHIG